MAIMREHGGNIDARTQPDGGASFMLTFPTATADMDEAPKHKPAVIG